MQNDRKEFVRELQELRNQIRDMEIQRATDNLSKRNDSIRSQENSDPQSKPELLKPDAMRPEETLSTTNSPNNFERSPPSLIGRMADAELTSKADGLLESVCQRWERRYSGQMNLPPDSGKFLISPTPGSSSATTTGMMAEWRHEPGQPQRVAGSLRTKEESLRNEIDALRTQVYSLRGQVHNINNSGIGRNPSI